MDEWRIAGALRQTGDGVLKVPVLLGSETRSVLAENGAKRLADFG